MPPGGHIVVGLIGGIACGKSTVARMFRRLGARVIDADEIARTVLRKREVKAALRAKFGGGVIDRRGAVNRRALAARVFRSAHALRFLNRLIHPAVLREIGARLRQQRRGPKLASRRRGRTVSGGRRVRASMVVLDAPLLLETGLDRFCSHLVFVEAPLALRRKRVVERRGWGAAELSRREAHQVGLKKKRALADFVIDNSGSLSSTRKQVEMIVASVRTQAKPPE